MQKERIIRFCKYCGIKLIILLFLIFIYKCPLYYFFHVPCPGCGITRAYIAALHLDFKLAFQYHPLFFTVVPMILYFEHRNLFKKHLNKNIELILFCSILLLFLLIYFIRLIGKDFGVLYNLQKRGF